MPARRASLLYDHVSSCCCNVAVRKGFRTATEGKRLGESAAVKSTVPALAPRCWTFCRPSAGIIAPNIFQNQSYAKWCRAIVDANELHIGVKYYSVSGGGSDNRRSDVEGSRAPDHTRSRAVDESDAMRVLACSITMSRFRMSSVNGDLGINNPSGLLIRAIQPAPRRLTWIV